jgi:TolB protein
MKRTLPISRKAQPPAAANAAHHLAGWQWLVPCIRTETPNLFLVSADSGDARSLTCNRAMNRYPAWSPDHAQCVFTSDLDGAHNIYTVSADGARLKQLTFETTPAICFLPSWSADGKIVFGRDRSGLVEIVAMNADGSGMVPEGTGTDPCVSPDGRAIAFTQKKGNGYCVWLMDARGKKVRPLTAHENQIGAVVPTWSPDGREILYSDQVGEALEIFVCSAKTGKARQLTHLGLTSTSAAWSPDGQWISFRVSKSAFWRNAAAYQKAQKQRDTLRPVYVMRADGTNPQVVEPMRYQCATDGSRAVWRARPKVAARD